MPLTPKQERFCEEYLVDLNATQAAIRSGYSKKTARQIGEQTLAKLDIQTKINELRAEQSKRTGVTADAVIAELAKVGFSRLDHFANVRKGLADPDDPNSGMVTFVSFKPTEEIPEDSLPALAQIKSGRDGIQIKLHDKVKALELLGRHLGIYEVDNKQKPASAVVVPYSDDQINKIIDAVRKQRKAG